METMASIKTAWRVPLHPSGQSAHACMRSGSGRQWVHARARVGGSIVGLHVLCTGTGKCGKNSWDGAYEHAEQGGHLRAQQSRQGHHNAHHAHGTQTYLPSLSGAAYQQWSHMCSYTGIKRHSITEDGRGHACSRNACKAGT